LNQSQMEEENKLEVDTPATQTADVDSAGETTHEPKVVAYLSDEHKQMFRKMHPQRNTFTFSGKGGIIISSDFDSGNLAACEQTKELDGDVMHQPEKEKKEPETSQTLEESKI